MWIKTRYCDDFAGIRISFYQNSRRMTHICRSVIVVIKFELYSKVYIVIQSLFLNEIDVFK